jgi:hypothetical protein
MEPAAGTADWPGRGVMAMSKLPLSEDRRGFKPGGAAPVETGAGAAAGAGSFVAGGAAEINGSLKAAQAIFFVPAPRSTSRAVSSDEGAELA